MAIKATKVISEAERAERKRREAEKERLRAQMAFSAILATMAHIVREEVSHKAIEIWRSDLNVLRNVGEKVKTKDFLINSPAADPFNADHYEKWGEWFLKQWLRFKPGATKVHVRGLHYAVQALSETPDAVYMPNGKLYENTDACWKALERAGKYARYTRRIDPGIFDDRRSRDAKEYGFSTSTRSLDINDDRYAFDFVELEDLPTFPDFPEMPYFPSLPRYSFSFNGQQRYRLEVWIEKSTQESVIQPVCDRHGVTSVTAQGEISVSSMWKAIDRARKYSNRTTTIILYISDFDPAGKSMPVAASRKLEFLRWLRGSTVPMRLYPIALTHDQCLHYKLPRTPIKESDRRRSGFEYRYGSGATELDALESLHPGELARLLEQSILRFRDNSLGERVAKKRLSIREELTSIQREIHARHGMDDLMEEYERVAALLPAIEATHDLYEGSYLEFIEQYNRDVRAPFDRWCTEYLEPLRDKLHTAMKAVVNEMDDCMPDIDEYEMPEGEEVPLDNDCLYDSGRDYIPQLAVYKQFAGKFEHLVEEEDEE